MSREIFPRRAWARGLGHRQELFFYKEKGKEIKAGVRERVGTDGFGEDTIACETGATRLGKGAIAGLDSFHRV